MPKKSLEHLSAKLADRIGDELSTFEGFDVRADAGEKGMIYVALRGARRETEAGERLADEVATLVDVELDGENVGFAISLGKGNKDLLLQIELRRT